jgi:hypothetical protein
MHGLAGGLVESESFKPEFIVPACYDLPKMKEN